LGYRCSSTALWAQVTPFFANVALPLLYGIDRPFICCSGRDVVYGKKDDEHNYEADKVEKPSDNVARTRK
jgi:hypothetical protein